jgi:hypothetical protein
MNSRLAEYVPANSCSPGYVGETSGTTGSPFCIGSTEDLPPTLGVDLPEPGALLILNGATVGKGTDGIDRKCEVNSSSISGVADRGGGCVGGMTTGGGEEGRDNVGSAHVTDFLRVIVAEPAEFVESVDDPECDLP